jgi:hypothetical protein
MQAKHHGACRMATANPYNPLPQRIATTTGEWLHAISEHRQALAGPPAVQLLLQQILGRLQGMEGRLQGMEGRLQGMEQGQTRMTNTLDRLAAAKVNSVMCQGPAGRHNPIVWPNSNGQPVFQQVAGAARPATKDEVLTCPIEAVDALLEIYNLGHGPQAGAGPARRNVLLQHVGIYG